MFDLKTNTWKSFFITAFSALIFHSQIALTCPIGAKETDLTIQRVMRNFGKFFSTAEITCVTGKDQPSQISETQLEKSIADLNILMSCTHAVLNDKSESLLPTRRDSMNDEDRAKYTEQFLNHMTLFEVTIKDVKSDLETELKKNSEQRNYIPCYEHTKLINQIVNAAHSHF